jgi:hypothetical protein
MGGTAAFFVAISPAPSFSQKVLVIARTFCFGRLRPND